MAHLSFSANITQTGADTHGFFSATGTGTITGGTCFSSFSVDPSSIVIGPNSTLVFDNSQSGSLGKTTLQGTFIPQAFGGVLFVGGYSSTNGACTDTGIVQLSAS